MKIVGTALSTELGDHLIPVVINAGRIFAESGPKHLKVFGTILKSVALCCGNGLE